MIRPSFARRLGSVPRSWGFALALAALPVTEARAQWVMTHDQFYLEAKHNWQFRKRYQAADRLFNAFDFGHAILYETLWSTPNAPTSELERRWYDRLTERILVDPPHVPLEETAIEPGYAKLAPEAKVMFEWAHILHRQVYDVLSDQRLSEPQREAEIARLVAYYRTRPDVAFSSKPKSMALMQEQPYSLAFRRNYPKFNGLIWAYHWLQVGLYEPLLVNRTPESQQAGVRATVARFWQMLESPPSRMPHVMPMTAAIAPTFTQRYQEAAIIFDNLHSMHDVISDVLANPSVPRNRKRAEIILAARRFRDDTSFVMTVEAWRTMAQHMGIENMGGPAVNFLTDLPKPTVTYGAVMTHDDRTGEMTGFKFGSATGGQHAGMAHGAVAAPDTARAGAGHAAHGQTGVRADSAAARPAATPSDPHAAMGHRTPASGGDTSGAARANEMMVLHMRMMEDPVIRRRMMADTAMRRMMTEMVETMPAEHREHMEQLMREGSTTRAAPAAPSRARTQPTTARRQPGARPATRPATKKPAARPATKPPARPATKAPAKPADPHAGHKPPET
jgi:hypothetical protein